MSPATDRAPAVRLGIHLSIARGMAAMAREAVRTGCEAVQVFTRSPRGGRAKPLDSADVAKMKETLQGADIGPLIVHTPYYVLPANDDPRIGELATQIIREDSERAIELGASYVVVHAGHSRQGATAATAAVARRVSAAVAELAEAGRADEVLVLIENGAGGRGDASASLGDWAACLHGVREAGLPIGACLDTAHLWGAGWPPGDDPVEALVDRLCELDIAPLLRVIHLNDSACAAGSGRDKHVHLGTGQIPLKTLGAILHHPAFAGLVGIVETNPANDGSAKDIALLKRLRAGRRPGPRRGPGGNG